MNKPENNLLIRVDANADLGSGHFMRCLAMAQALRSLFTRIEFLTTCESPILLKLLAKEGFFHFILKSQPGTPSDAEELVAHAGKKNVRMLIIDGYHFGTAYIRITKGCGSHTVLVDDMGKLEEYEVDCIINSGLHANQHIYKNRHPKTSLLLGPSYVILREEFSRWRGWKREVKEPIENVLVTFGGADSGNGTGWVLNEILKSHKSLKKIRAIVGPHNPHYSMLRQFESEEVELINAPDNMAKEMVWADLCIGAAGSTVWELALLGLPSLLFVTASNQQEGARALNELGLFRLTDQKVFANDFTALTQDSSLRSKMSAKLQNYVDGFGGERLLIALDKAIQAR